MKPIVRYLTDTTLNDSDKTETVPSGKTREVLAIGIQLTSTATVGNRQIAYEVQDSNSNVIYAAYAGATQAASLVREYHFSQGIVADTAFSAGNSIRVELPGDLLLPPDFKMRVYDQAAIDAAADDMEVRYVQLEFPL